MLSEQTEIVELAALGFPLRRTDKRDACCLGLINEDVKRSRRQEKPVLCRMMVCCCRYRRSPLCALVAVIVASVHVHGPPTSPSSDCSLIHTSGFNIQGTVRRRHRELWSPSQTRTQAAQAKYPLKFIWRRRIKARSRRDQPISNLYAEPRQHVDLIHLPTGIGTGMLPVSRDGTAEASCSRPYRRSHLIPASNTLHTSPSPRVVSMPLHPKAPSSSLFFAPSAAEAPRPRKVPPQYRSMISGAGAGFVASIVTCPLDVLKTALQASQHGAKSAEYEGVRATAYRIWRQSGVRGFYRGLGPTIGGYLPTWGIYFTVYDLVKDKLGTVAKDSGMLV